MDDKPQSHIATPMMIATVSAMIVQLVLSGLALGSMYALVALGYNITYATSQTVNFSQGQSVMVGAVVAYALYVGAGWPFVPSVLGTLIALAVFGVLVERVAVRPFLRASSIAWLLATIALGIIAENVAMLVFGKDAPDDGGGRLRAADLDDVARRDVELDARGRVDAGFPRAYIRLDGLRHAQENGLWHRKSQPGVAIY